jgi:hypothetical protein
MVFLSPGTVSPGVAEVSAFSWVVTTADAHSTPCPSLIDMTRSASAVSRRTTHAGTALPGSGLHRVYAVVWLVTAGVVALPDPQAAAASTGISPISQEARLMSLGRIIADAGSRPARTSGGAVALGHESSHLPARGQLARTGSRAGQMTDLLSLVQRYITFAWVHVLCRKRPS